MCGRDDGSAKQMSAVMINKERTLVVVGHKVRGQASDDEYTQIER